MKELIRRIKSKKTIAVIFITSVLFLGIAFIIANRNGAQKDIIILYTNDVHCGIETNIGYDGLASYKAKMEEQTPHVVLVDCGDAVQGDFIGLVSGGSYVVDVMNQVGYDFAALGNHEFDYGMKQLQNLLEQSQAQYLACNITYMGSGESALKKAKPYEIVAYGNVKVAFIGVTTPESISSSTPSNFKEEGEYVYDFANHENGEELYRCVQDYVDECREKGADYCVVLSHLGDGELLSPFSCVELAQKTSGVDVILDGHAHSVIPCMVKKNKEGEEVLISSTGTKLSNIGQLVITANGTIMTGLISDYDQKEEETTAFIQNIKGIYEEDLKTVAGTTDTKLSIYAESGARLVRNRETAIGNFCADAYRYVSGADIALVNGGGIRADFPEGEITYADLFAVHPFGNTLCMVEATGQEILDCLEMCYRFVQTQAEEDGVAVGEDGGFQQVSGIQFTVDTDVESSVVVDEYDMFVSVNGERRVKNVMILGDQGEYELLDPEKIYTVASHNYLLKEGGSGCGMFADNVFIIDEGMADYQILVDYISEELEGDLGMKYARTEGRITIE